MDGTMGMTFFSDLGHLKDDSVTGKNRSHRKFFQIKAFDQKIFSKITVFDFCPSLFKGFHCLFGKKAHLPVPFSCMRVPFQAFIFDKNGFPYIFLSCSFFFTDADCPYISHSLSSYPCHKSFFCLMFRIFLLKMVGLRFLKDRLAKCFLQLLISCLFAKKRF